MGTGSASPPSSPTPRRRLGWLGTLVALALSLLVAFAYLRVGDSPVATAIEGQTLTWRFLLRGPAAPPGDVAIVAIDDRTVAEAGRFPLPRRILADAVARLHAAGAAVIGLDLLLIDPEPPGDGITASPGDRLLRDALQDAPLAVLAAAFTPRPGAPPDECLRFGEQWHALMYLALEARLGAWAERARVVASLQRLSRKLGGCPEVTSSVRRPSGERNRRTTR